MSLPSQAAQQAAQLKKRAWSHFDLNQFDDALATFDQIIALDPDSAPFALEKGVALFRMGRYADALVAFDAVADRHPTNTTAINNSAKCLSLLGRLADAADRYAESLRVNPAPAKTWTDAAAVLARLDRFDEAFAHLETAADRDPHNPDTWHQYGVICRQAQQLDDAIVRFDHALSLSNDTHRESLRDRGATLRQKGMPREALDSLQSAARLKPNSSDTELEIGECLLDLRQPDKAAHVFDAIIRRERDNAAAWDGKGRAFLAQNDLPRAALHRATSLMIQGDLDPALVAIDEALALQPKYPEALSNKGVILNRLGRFQDAVAAYKLALQQDPGALPIMHNLGMILYYELDQKAEAVQLFRETIRRDRARWAKLPSDIRRAVDAL
jgi:tetratricopeptide (TPR) repeat protein